VGELLSPTLGLNSSASAVPRGLTSTAYDPILQPGPTTRSFLLCMPQSTTLELKSNDCFVRVCTPPTLTSFDVCIKLY